MTLKLKKHEGMLLALLRAALKEKKAEEEYFRNCKEEEWEKCNQLSIEQGVMCLAWDGILTLPAELMPPRRLKLKWSVAVAMYERQYELYCKTAAELTELYARHGIATTVLKGVGMSTLYPKPEHREGGDIDIYTYSADRSKMSDSEANKLADDLMRQQRIDVDLSHNPMHSIFQINGITVENHNTFINARRLPVVKRIHAFLHTCTLEEPVKLARGKYNIRMPDIQFNTIYIPAHTGNHFACGLKLHHLCDWACILYQNGLRLPDGLKDKHFNRIISTLTSFTNLYLNTQIPGYSSKSECAKTFKELFIYSKEYKSKSGIHIFQLLHNFRWRIHIARSKRRFFGESLYINLKEPIHRHVIATCRVFNKQNRNIPRGVV